MMCLCTLLFRLYHFSYHFSTEYVCGWVCGLIIHFITFIHDVRSHCGLCAAHHCFHCYFRCFFTASCFRCFFTASCFRCFFCCFSPLVFYKVRVSKSIFMLCCFLTLFSVSGRNTLCRNCTLLCMPSFFNYSTECVCVCVCLH